jgi:dTDP-4-amino-4,6-dideoxygalactose transaminase
MHVPLLDLGEQYDRLAGQIREQLDQVFASHRFILGPKVEAFEKAMADYCGVPHAIGVSSGTDALLAALMALGIGPGDAVITTAYSFFATAGCIARVGATPLFVDIDSSTYNISPGALRDFAKNRCRKSNGTLRTDDGKTVRAIMPVHLFGLCCDMDAVQEITRDFGLALIEDAAQAIGSEYPAAQKVPRKAGTMGTVGCFSFYPSKNLGAAGDAGLIICHDGDLAKRLRVCRQHGMEPRYYHQFIGGNFRLDEIQAAILTVKLPYLETWSAARRTAADFYRAEIKQRRDLADKITLPAEPYRQLGLTNHHIYHQFVIRTPRREQLRRHLVKREIETAIYYPLGLHQQKCFAYLGYKEGDLPETERAARESLALPIYPEISREAQRYVVEAIAEFFNQ